MSLRDLFIVAGGAVAGVACVELLGPRAFLSIAAGTAAGLAVTAAGSAFVAWTSRRGRDGWEDLREVTLEPGGEVYEGAPLEPYDVPRPSGGEAP